VQWWQALVRVPIRTERSLAMMVVRVISGLGWREGGRETHKGE